MKILSWFLVLAGVFGLIAVRMFEEPLFYDPFLQYFKSADKNAIFPLSQSYFLAGDRAVFI